MEAVCARDAPGCPERALTAALHVLHLYCGVLAAVLLACCAPVSSTTSRYGKHHAWRGQSARGAASLVAGAAWCGAAGGALLRRGQRVALAAALAAPPAWLAAGWLHAALWRRRAAAPLLYLALYWLLAAAASAATLAHHVRTGASALTLDIYIQALSACMCLIVAMVDCLCFYDEVTKRNFNRRSSSTEHLYNTAYLHNEAHFYSKVTFFWLNPLLYRGYKAPLEKEDLGELPENEKSSRHYQRFKRIYFKQLSSKCEERSAVSLWRCYARMIWPNFFLAGVLKMISDFMALVPPLGLAVVIHFIEEPQTNYNLNEPVTIYEYFNHGYVMLFIVTMALIAQALLSQNSTNLVTVEGIRLKTALQATIFDKCMRLAPWASTFADSDEESPLLNSAEQTDEAQSGLLTNLISQDTYNIMSCVWILHYTWAIPIKVSAILYLLYTKLGISAVIGSIVGILIITPLQFYVGKKISKNSKSIAKCTDHRISKMTEILQGIDVIKLYVWEDLFKEKILNLREVELQHLNKDSIYWNLITFSTQVSTILVSVTTFAVYSFLGDSKNLTAVNVFAALALFNQLTVPLLILPVTVLMIIQARVSSKRIKDFLDLPESTVLEKDDSTDHTKKSRKFNEAFISSKPEDSNSDSDDNYLENNIENGCLLDDNTSPPSNNKHDSLVRIQNAIFSWGVRNDSPPLEVDDLDIPAGKLIMVVGPTGSGKSSLLSAILEEMYLEKGDVIWNGPRSTWYAGQPPWLLDGSIRDNILMGSPWCQRRYARVVRATGLTPDLDLLPEGDATLLARGGVPLSGGQRTRLAVARALYSRARLLLLDEPLGALDPALARLLLCRALRPAARHARTVLLATHRIEFMHYADLVIVMEDGRVSAFGRADAGGGCGGDEALSRWARLAAEARAVAARGGPARAGGGGGTARERTRLVREMARRSYQRHLSDDVPTGACDGHGAAWLARLAVCGGSWRGGSTRARSTLAWQLSSPPPASRCRREVRRVVSADGSSSTLRREGSLARRLLRARPHCTLARWTPRSLRRLLSSDTEAVVEDEDVQNNDKDMSAVDTTYSSVTSNGVETDTPAKEPSTDREESSPTETQWHVWREYGRACGWWGAVWVAAVLAAQVLAVVGDCGLAQATARHTAGTLASHQEWQWVWWYVCVSALGLAAAGSAGAAGSAAGARARRHLHDRLLHSTLHAPLSQHRAAPLGQPLHRFSADVQVIDRKLWIALSRWAGLALLVAAALLVCAAAAPLSLLALLPAVLLLVALQAVYLRSAREFQRAEALSAAPAVSLARAASAGGASIRAAGLQRSLRGRLLLELDHNHNALLLLNAANRWLGLSLDLVGAGVVGAALAAAAVGGGGALAGLAGAHALLLPAYLAHLAKCRAELSLQLAALDRVLADTRTPQEDYREHCSIPEGWPKNGDIELEKVTVRHRAGAAPIVSDVTISIASGEMVAVSGRSGSGKSSLLLSLAGAGGQREGRVRVAGVDVERVPLRALRRRLVVLPQEPALFAGTLRENLDPLAVHADSDIWHALRVVGLYDYVAAQSAGLECVVGGGRGAAGAAWRVLPRCCWTSRPPRCTPPPSARCWPPCAAPCRTSRSSQSRTALRRSAGTTVLCWWSEVVLWSSRDLPACCDRLPPPASS